MQVFKKNLIKTCFNVLHCVQQKKNLFTHFSLDWLFTDLKHTALECLQCNILSRKKELLNFMAQLNQRSLIQFCIQFPHTFNHPAIIHIHFCSPLNVIKEWPRGATTNKSDTNIVQESCQKKCNVTCTTIILVFLLSTSRQGRLKN